jgi:hypothetical protein
MKLFLNPTLNKLALHKFKLRLKKSSPEIA